VAGKTVECLVRLVREGWSAAQNLRMSGVEFADVRQDAARRENVGDLAHRLQARDRGRQARSRGIQARDRGIQARDRGRQARDRGRQVRDRGSRARDRGRQNGRMPRTPRTRGMVSGAEFADVRQLGGARP
jgi:uncharacterized protein (DUF3084 family)